MQKRLKHAIIVTTALSVAPFIAFGGQNNVKPQIEKQKTEQKNTDEREEAYKLLREVAMGSKIFNTVGLVKYNGTAFVILKDGVIIIPETQKTDINVGKGRTVTSITYTRIKDYSDEVKEAGPIKKKFLDEKAKRIWMVTEKSYLIVLHVDDPNPKEYCSTIQKPEVVGHKVEEIIPISEKVVNLVGAGESSYLRLTDCLPAR